MSVIVFADYDTKGWTKSSIESIVYGEQIAQKNKSSLFIVSYGDIPSVEQISKYGANEILVDRAIKQPDAYILSKLIETVAKEKSATELILVQDQMGKMIGGMLSIYLKAGLVMGASSLPNEQGYIKRNAYSGKAIATVKVTTNIKIICILKNSISIVEKEEKELKITPIKLENIQNKVSTKNIRMLTVEGTIPLPDAVKVVSAGRGLQGAEDWTQGKWNEKNCNTGNWENVLKLAEILGAATACSRPVGDLERRPHHEHVGQTGISIRPNLYIAIGISGAIQHLAGVNGSKIIVVINKDAEAPFFKFAHYGIIGDAFTIVPKLIEALKK